jgi:hypothetical protein
MPVILDTDHLSVLQWQEQPSCDRLLARLDRLPPDDIATTVIGFHDAASGISQEQLEKAASEALRRGLVRRTKLIEAARTAGWWDRFRPILMDERITTT